VNGDEHTIDLTGGGSPGAPVNGNGQVARNGSTRGNVGGDGHGRADGRANGDGTRSAPDADVLLGDEHPVSTGGELDGIEWYPSYDRLSVELHLRELDAERDRLNEEIRAAERQTAEAEATLAARTAALEAGLGAVVVAARAELARIERERDEAVAAIRADAEAEAARIREAARTEAATVRGATSSLAHSTDLGGPGAD
jgi:hypothetical protein